jgi:lipid-A-disaccharide synthase
MKPKTFMLIAGEASGDLLAAELVQALRREFEGAAAMPTTDFQPLYTNLQPRFFGAGGPRMAAAGVELAFDLTAHSVIGLSDVVKNYVTFRRLFHQLYQLAIEREPDAIVCVDFSGFNRRFAHEIKEYVRWHTGWFHDWNPRIIQYVSPQVWASREGRARQMARDYDLLVSIFPFEKEWYAQRVPQLRVEFVGHPIVERYADSAVAGCRLQVAGSRSVRSEAVPAVSSLPHGGTSAGEPSSPLVLLLPGSRANELRRHVPVMIGALEAMRATIPELRARMVLADENLLEQAKLFGLPVHLERRVGGLPEALTEADVAIASTGTVTLECAYFGVPTVAMYRTSWSTYQIAKRIVRVRYLAMPNLLAEEEVFPEFIQNAATPENIARAALEFLRDAARRKRIKARLAEIVAGLGGPGASRRAAKAVVGLLARATQGERAIGAVPAR